MNIQRANNKKGHVTSRHIKPLSMSPETCYRKNDAKIKHIYGT